MGAYYNNSLRHWRRELQDRLRQSMARYGRLERAMSPREDQGKCVDFIKKQLALVEEEMTRESVPAWDDARDGIF